MVKRRTPWKWFKDNYEWVKYNWKNQSLLDFLITYGIMITMGLLFVIGVILAWVLIIGSVVGFALFVAAILLSITGVI